MPQLSAPVHLSKFEKTILSGGEWLLESSDWVVMQLREGIAYSLDSKANKELPRAGVILCPPKTALTVTASVLGKAVLCGMAIRLGSLTGFLSALERQSLENDVARRCQPFLALPSDHPLARRLSFLLAQEQELNFSDRLAFVQMFAEIIAPYLQEALLKEKDESKNQQDAKGRLRDFIRQIPESELSDLSLGDMAKMLHCCERHASRLFREEWGTGFLSYVSDLRLKKACDLLLQGHLKIIDVALESGHGSLAHFNYAFKKRYHMTPTEWRERHTAPPPRPTRQFPRSRPLQIAGALVLLMLSVAGVTRAFGAAAGAAAGASQPAQPSPGSGTNAAVPGAAPAGPRFRVDRYEVKDNTLLPSNLIDRVLAPYTGPAVGIDTITNARAALKMEYFRRGFETVDVLLPNHQDLSNHVVLLQAVEGRLSTVKILHNRYFSSNNIMAQLPYLVKLQEEEGILNAKIFETELSRANANADRQISSVVQPGLDPGTSALVLDVKDRLPLHGRLEWDNYSPPGTPELRVNANASYANLWQLDHTLGVQYGFSPEELKPSLGRDTHLSLNPMDGPEVSYYSGFYRAPLGAPAAVENQIAQDQTHFGYNETTKQFTLPPTLGRPEFSAFASRSTTGPTIYGPEASVVNNTNLMIQQQLISQQYTSQTTAGGRFSFPLPQWGKIQSTWSIGMDYKEDKVVTLPTNNFYYTTIVTHGNGVSSLPTVNRSSIAIPGVATYPSLQYTPFSLGWNAWRQDHLGQREPVGDLSSQFNAGLSLVAGTGGTFSRERAFPLLIANTPEATTEFLALRPQLSRTQVLPDNFTFFENLAGQWANVPLLNLEQFELGGNASVRGYREGELYADTGWISQSEFRSPIFWRGASAMKIGTQLTAFSDYGVGYHLDQSAGSEANRALWGAGVGVNFNFGQYVQSHILIAWPLLNSADSVAGHERISFSLSAQL